MTKYAVWYKTSLSCLAVPKMVLIDHQEDAKAQQIVATSQHLRLSVEIFYEKVSNDNRKNRQMLFVKFLIMWNLIL